MQRKGEEESESCEASTKGRRFTSDWLRKERSVSRNVSLDLAPCLNQQFCVFCSAAVVVAVVVVGLPVRHGVADQSPHRAAGAGQGLDVTWILFRRDYHPQTFEWSSTLCS